MKKFLWFLALIGSSLMAAFFCWVVVFYLLHFHPTWRVLIVVFVAIFWLEITRMAFGKFRGQNST